MQSAFHKFFAAILLLGLFCWPQNSLSAQEEREHRAKQRYGHELGLNATALLDKLLRFQGDSAAVNPYLLNYRFSRGRIGLRFSAGGRHHFERNTQDGFRDSESDRLTIVDARLGLDYRFRFGRRFAGNFGVDAVSKWRYDRNVIDSGFDVVTRTEQFSAWGAGPAVSLTFWLTPHLGLCTEAAFYLLYGETERARNFKNFPELDDEIFRENTEDFSTILPSNLFVIYRF